MLLNCGVGEDSWESLGLQGDQTNPKQNQSWIFIKRTDAEAEAPILWPPDAKSWLTRKKRPWCWERLKAGEGDDRGWDGWMASLTQWPWARTSSRIWWRTGKPGVLQSIGPQRIGHNWATKQWKQWHTMLRGINMIKVLAHWQLYCECSDTKMILSPWVISPSLGTGNLPSPPVPCRIPREKQNQQEI